MRTRPGVAGLRADIDDAHGLALICYVGMLGRQLLRVLHRIGVQSLVGDQHNIVQIPFQHGESEFEPRRAVGPFRREFDRGDHRIAGMVFEHTGITGMAGIVETAQMQFAIHPIRHICQQIGIGHCVGEHHFHL